VSWPPATGEPLPRAAQAFGVREKLTRYCLNRDHEIGGPKAVGFLQVLGIAASDVDYLASALLAGILEAPVTAVRDNAPFGVLCGVRVAVRGVHQRRERIATVTTSWELRSEGEPPRLVTAYIAG
jgi:hypothetical protein